MLEILKEALHLFYWIMMLLTETWIIFLKMRFLEFFQTVLWFVVRHILWLMWQNDWEIVYIYWNGNYIFLYRHRHSNFSWTLVFMKQGQNTLQQHRFCTLCHKYVSSLTSSASHVILKMQEIGPTVYGPYLRRLEYLTICRCHYKGGIFSSVLLRPWVLVQS